MRKKSGKATSVKKTARRKLSEQFETHQPAVFPIVGIGASAGGVEASSEMLKYLRPDLGMAYVFVHHLSAKFDSHLTEILQRQTSMPVSKVSDGMKIEPNHVYVIPPDTYMRIENGCLKLGATSRLNSSYGSIDYFLTSLAGACQGNAIGILLSGIASDGTTGLTEIKEAGGITFAQDESAKYEGMSVHAQAAGFVDCVLSPQRISEELASLVHYPFAVALPNDNLVRNEKEIKKILAIILNKYGVDFFLHYKRATIYRRIMRRMALNKIVSFEEYIKKLKNSDDEANSLYQDFLINVTSFFREPDFYQSLTKVVLPQLVRNRQPTDPLRLWISGCATGEEAYSTGICIAEYMEEKKINIPVQIFSTDLDEKAIEKARLGLYSKNAVQRVSPQRLKKYFIRLDEHYQIIKTIRDRCIFPVHNLIKDPPFSKIDLISCQNVLIYIETAPQKKIMQAFHYALKPSGFLLLGKSESIGNATELFQPVEKDGKLYTKKNHPVIPQTDFLQRNPISLPQPVSSVQHESRTETDVEKEFDKLLLSRYVPASVLVNKDLDILRFRGSTARYLAPASGKASLNLLKMAKDELIFELRSLMQKAKKTEATISKKDIAFGGDGTLLAIEIVPIKSSKDIYYLIIFQENFSGPTIPVIKKIKGSKSDQRARIIKMEQALKDAREQVRTITEDFDVNREELQSANEEILSANEELQSINEELETSKEELQSSNEELTTINEELQMRLAELKETKEYIEAIVETMHSPLLVLNSQFRVRTANNAFYSFFKLKPEETEGKYVHDLAIGQWDIPSLRDHLREIFPKKINFRNFEIHHDFPRIGERILVVNAHRLVRDKTEDDTLVVVAFQDITPHRQASNALLHTQEQLKLALEGGKVGTWMWNLKTNKVTGSREEALIFGREENSFIRDFAEWQMMVHADDLPDLKALLQHSIDNKIPMDTEFRILWPDKSIRWVLSKANTYYDEAGNPDRMVGVNIDITEKKRAIEVLEESERRFHTMSDNAPVMIWMTDADKKCKFLNKTWLLFTGRKPAEELGDGWFNNVHPDDRENFLELFNASNSTHTEFKIDYRLRRHDGEYRWIMGHGIPRYAGNEGFIGFIGTCIDISDRVDLERQKDDFMSIASHELKTPVTSIKAYTQILQQKFNNSVDETSAHMLARLDAQIDKLTSLINTLLDVARIQSGQMEYEEKEFDLGALLLEVKEELQPSYPNHEIVVNTIANGKIVGDKTRVAQVLSNLISNAVKYSPDASKVIAQTNRVENDLVVTIQDFGLGIPKEAHEKIFGRFFRISESSGNRVSGLGLGLYISAQIIRQQGGNIWLESEPGRGSKFSFSLPQSSVAGN